MKIGILKEVKDQEKRVGLTPKNIRLLHNHGHMVYVQENAGIEAGFSDDEYSNSGAIIVGGKNAVIDIVDKVDIVVKIKEPIESEYYWIKHMNKKILFTFLHLAANKELAKQLLENNVTGISYDTIEDEDGNLPLLKPMSIIAGESSIELAIKHKSKLDKVFVLGGGIAGTAAVKKALELDATNVCIFEPNVIRAAQLEKEFYDYPVDVASCIKYLTKELYKSDIIIGAALKKGQKAPQVLDEEMVKNLKQGAFIVDISIDQGGCIFGSRPTTHSEPIYDFEGKTFCCIPNLPGQKPKEATEAITNLSVPILLSMVSSDPIMYLNASKGLIRGLNTHQGIVVNDVVAKELDFKTI